MKIRAYLFGLTLGLTGLVVTSCDRKLETGNDLSNQNKDFIKSLGVLDDKENIILFDSQGGGFNGLKTSGNFFTDRRIASYWIDTKIPPGPVLTMLSIQTSIRSGDIQNLNH